MSSTQTANTTATTFMRAETLPSGYHAVMTDGGEPIEYHWMAYCSELPGCMADGRTADEARDELAALIPEFIALLREDGLRVPEQNAHLGHQDWDHKTAYTPEETK